jgi:hypothetical protein
MSIKDTWTDFPRIGLIVDGKKKFYPLREAIPLWDSGWMKVEDTGEVLEADYSVRKMTAPENAEFQELTDEYSGSK